MFTILLSMMGALFLVQADPAKPKDGMKEPKYDFSLHLSVDRAVDFALRQEDKVTGKLVEKIYKADSIDQFMKNYPEVAKKYRIDRFLQCDDLPCLDVRDSDKKYEEWKLKFDKHWFWDRSHPDDIENWFGDLPKALQTDDLRHWFEEQRAGFEKFRQLHPTIDLDRGVGEGASNVRPALGVLIAPVGDTLAFQLGFKTVEGIVFASVKKDSLADRSGIRMNDIALKINGKVIPNTAFFQTEVSSSLKEFVLDILRQGKHETITVQCER